MTRPRILVVANASRSNARALYKLIIASQGCGGPLHATIAGVICNTRSGGVPALARKFHIPFTLHNGHWQATNYAQVLKNSCADYTLVLDWYSSLYKFESGDPFETHTTICVDKDPPNYAWFGMSFLYGARFFKCSIEKTRSTMDEIKMEKVQAYYISLMLNLVVSRQIVAHGERGSLAATPHGSIMQFFE